MQVALDYPQVTVVSPCGTINAANALEFERDLTKALTEDESSILLVDLNQVESLDSAGLMALVSALKLAQNLSKGFSLCSVSPSLKIIFELTQLDRVFEIHESKAAFEATCLNLNQRLVLA